MQHIKPISALPRTAQGTTTPIEAGILVLLTIFFPDWDNFQTVITNLSKFYAKTP
jgi:hypothetical protein